MEENVHNFKVLRCVRKNDATYSDLLCYGYCFQILPYNN